MNFQDSIFSKKLVFRLGTNAGFFSEYNNMLLGIIYCLEKKINFQLYSKDANFSFNEGWNDYFLPFTKETKWNYHKNYNYRSFSEFNHYKSDTLIRKINFYKFISCTKYLTYEIFDEIRKEAKSNRIYKIPKLNIHGEIREVCRELINLTWHFNNATQQIINKLISKINLPENYIGIHIRSGDKQKENELFNFDKYIAKAKTLSNEKNYFISTDDFSNIESIKKNYPDLNIYYLCKENKKGYFQNEFQKLNKENIRTEMYELFSSIEILNKSEFFVGTFSSNIGMFLGMRMLPEKCFAVDLDKWLIW